MSGDLPKGTDQRFSRVRALVVGQTPPPFHGQGIMLERLVNAKFENVETLHVRMAFSRTMDEVGRAGIGKVVHLLQIILRIVWARLTFRPHVFYYPPAGPNRVPMWRDIVILICTRWMFPKTVFHMQASGISQLYSQLGTVGQWLFRKAYFRPDGLVRLSEFTIDDAAGLEARDEFVVPNCADDVLSRFQEVRKTRSSEVLQILYLGTVCRTKGILILIEACAALLADGISFELNVVGSFQPAEFESHVRVRIKDAGLDQKVKLHGQLTGDGKFSMLAAADIFCFPSFYESEAFPCVVVEAMSFGLPVVSTRWRGIQSIVDDGETGYLVQPENADELALALRKVAGDFDLRLKLGEAGRLKYEQQYTTPRHLDLMEDVLVRLGVGDAGMLPGGACLPVRG